MAIKSSNLSTSKTIRDFLGSQLVDGAEFKITIGGELQQVFEVDVIWDGTNYYLSYTTENSNIINVIDLDSALPFQITPPAITPPSTEEGI